MALYVLFENKNTLLCIYFICLLFNLQMCQIILADPVEPSTILTASFFKSRRSQR